jgi:tight adherence protein B
LLGVAAAAAAALAAWGLGLGPVPALAVAVTGVSAPWATVARRRQARLRRIEQQFPQALDLLGRALRAGHAFSAAVRMAAEELPDPLVREFRLLFEEMNYGVAVPEALSRFASRVPLADAGYFAVAVTIQREAGGNLAEVLDNIASLVRERLRLRGEVRTLSAEGRLSAVILTALPFAVAGVVQAVNPGFLAVLWTDPAGLRVVGVALAGMAVGVVWMRSIIRIRI